MGLDITAYRQLRERADISTDFALDHWDQFFVASAVDWANSHWPGRGDPVKEGLVYGFAEKLGFPAGSYGNYGRWRSWLARVAGYAGSDSYWSSAPEGAPFYELINFADNEGVIGSVVAKKLADDFAKFQDVADADGGEWERAKYADWRKAFEMAADGGCVDFH